ncbi:Protein CBG10259 [Caenorhabditis briggsae]|uniref:Protein CBG10259 n=2 Tax=Caenorhabditis briggsae TaxID=6238 RepID=A8XAR6_CAEBR|nr:Protein CBG10259 [Caenorhabditis briggsae]ULT85099.1 hypothetical protein L3Y34_013656 [Caenorhabditis briggsae]CAP29731.2 Protein CBG10259 [Caenorhabditis briggsae]
MMSRPFNRIPAERVGENNPSIWVELGALASEINAVNLGQGFPDGPAPKFVTDQLKRISKHPELTCAHQYTSGYGHPKLVNELSKWYSYLYQQQVNAKSNILVTVGAYHALYYSFLAWINKGDEVIIIEPAFDCYAPQIKLAGGVPVSIAMNFPDGGTDASQFTVDFEKMESSITEKTKMIVINNPHNPSGKLFNRMELLKIADIAQKYDLIVVADEVYEFHCWGVPKMIRFASLPGMWNRTISIGSAGKVFSITGWKLGWAIGPDHLLAPLKAIHQNCTYACSTPTQLAVGMAFEKEWETFHVKPHKSYLGGYLPEELVKKNKKLQKMLVKAGFAPILPQAGYFMLANYTQINAEFKTLEETSELDDYSFTKWLCTEKKLAVIPLTAFFANNEDKMRNTSFVRFCFFKKDKTLNDAKKIMKNLSK